MKRVHAATKGLKTYAARKAKGICARCGRRPPRPDRVSCQPCQDSSETIRKTWNRNRRDRGECSRCAEPSNGFEVCTAHWYDRMSRLKNCEATAGELKEIFENQHGKCYYSNTSIIPQINASLDHRVPLSRGGTRLPQNLQWVTKLVNRMKTDLTDEEFIDACHHIISIRRPDILRDASAAPPMPSHKEGQVSFAKKRSKPIRERLPKVTSVIDAIFASSNGSEVSVSYIRSQLTNAKETTIRNALSRMEAEYGTIRRVSRGTYVAT